MALHEVNQTAQTVAGVLQAAQSIQRLRRDGRGAAQDHAQLRGESIQVGQEAGQAVGDEIDARAKLIQVDARADGGVIKIAHQRVKFRAGVGGKRGKISDGHAEVVRVAHERFVQRGGEDIEVVQGAGRFRDQAIGVVGGHETAHRADQIGEALVVQDIVQFFHHFGNGGLPGRDPIVLAEVDGVIRLNPWMVVVRSERPLFHFQIHFQGQADQTGKTQVPGDFLVPQQGVEGLAVLADAFDFGGVQLHDDGGIDSVGLGRVPKQINRIHLADGDAVEAHDRAGVQAGGRFVKEDQIFPLPQVADRPPKKEGRDGQRQAADEKYTQLGGIEFSSCHTSLQFVLAAIGSEIGAPADAAIAGPFPAAARFPQCPGSLCST